jgi:hypothetical protein
MAVLNSPDARLLEAAMFLGTMAAQSAVLGRRVAISLPILEIAENQALVAEKHSPRVCR